MVIRDFNNKRRRNKRKDYRNFLITERFLTMLLKAICCTNTYKRSTLLTIQSFINKIPIHEYEKDQSVFSILNILKIAIKYILENVVDKEDLIEYINMATMDVFEEEKENIIYPNILSADEITEKEKSLVQETINLYLRYETVLENVDDFNDIISDIASGNVQDLKLALEEFGRKINLIDNEFKKAETDEKEFSIVHTSDLDSCKEQLESSYNTATSPKMVLKTGLKMFNEMLSQQGGFLGGKFYMFYADTNTFKSALLKNITIWIQKYNSSLFMEEFLASGKRPTILSISLEDGANEDFSRLFTIYSHQDLVNEKSFSSAYDKWKNSMGDSIIDITHINTSEAGINLKRIESFVKKVEEEGYFVIAIIVDSFDLMSPSDEDIYQGITDETTILANRAKAIQKYIGDKPFPFITAHQLNRTGNIFITEKKEKGVVDLAKSLGRAFVSGAYDINRRVHFSAFIYLERNKYDGEWYLEINREKVKYKRTDVDYLVHWLEHGFLIHDDYGTDKVLSKSSIIEDVDIELGNGDSKNGLMSFGERGAISVNRVTPTNIITEEKKEDNNGLVMESSSSSSQNQETFYNQNNAVNVPVVNINLFNYYTMQMNQIELLNLYYNGINSYKKGEKYFYNQSKGVTPYDIK